MMRPAILIIDDREDILLFCERALGGTYKFRHATSASSAERVLREEPVSAVLLDRDFSCLDSRELVGPPTHAIDEGFHILRRLRADHAGLPVFMVTGHRDLQAALQATEMGADFLAWEDIAQDPGILEARLQQALETGSGGQESILARFRELGIVVESPACAKALCALHRAIPGRAPILLLGETGTGKDSLAYALHALSGDPLRPYVSVNVASLNPGIIESELFGHARGAFTGADRAGLGKLRFAHGGTLFLNEVGDLTPEVQAKLLTVLERNEVVPVGDVRSHPADFRLVTATSRELRTLVENGRFRRDLFHRIAWHTIEIPPLRERQEDIPALVQTFLRATALHHEEGVVFGIAREALEYLTTLAWAGNVRELRGVIEAASAGARRVITIGDVRGVIRRYEDLFASEPVAPSDSGATSSEAHALEPPVSPSSSVCEDAVFGASSYRDLTAAYYRYLLRNAAGRLPELARRAGISRATAYEWRARYGEEKAETQNKVDGHSATTLATTSSSKRVPI
jgi:DNA-binding NtrC family response regulator